MISKNLKKRIVGFCLGQAEVYLFSVEDGWELTKYTEKKTDIQVFPREEGFTIDDALFLFNRATQDLRGIEND